MLPFHYIDKDFNFVYNIIQNYFPMRFENKYNYDIPIDKKFKFEFLNFFPNLIPRQVIVFARPAGSVQKIHIDRVSKCALNLPLINSHTSYMYFYSGIFTKKFIDADILTDRTNLLDWTLGPFELAKCKISQPALVKTDIPHNVIHDDTGDRAIISIRFECNPSFSTVKQILC